MLTHTTYNSPVMLKIDIEGGEFDLLKRLLAEPRAFKLIDMFLGECHPSKRGARDCKGLQRLLDRAGYPRWESIHGYPERDTASSREVMEIDGPALAKANLNRPI